MNYFDHCHHYNILQGTTNMCCQPQCPIFELFIDRNSITCMLTSDNSTLFHVFYKHFAFHSITCSFVGTLNEEFLGNTSVAMIPSRIRFYVPLNEAT